MELEVRVYEAGVSRGTARTLRSSRQGRVGDRGEKVDEDSGT